LLTLLAAPLDLGALRETDTLWTALVSQLGG
jgi:hypothetical protein